MTPLRQRMIREMQLRQFTPRTIESYLGAVIGVSQFYQRSPDQLQLEEVRSYLHHMLVERKLAQSTCNLCAAAITFFYRQVLGQERFDLKFRRKHTGKLPEIYSAEELVRLFEATRCRRDRVFLMTTYAAGLRLSEVRHLKPLDIRENSAQGPEPHQQRPLAAYCFALTILHQRLFTPLLRHPVPIDSTAVPSNPFYLPGQSSRGAKSLCACGLADKTICVFGPLRILYEGGRVAFLFSGSAGVR